MHYGEYFITVQLPFLQQKKQCFWLPELASESTACKERDLVCLHKITSGLVGCKKRL